MSNRRGYSSPGCLTSLVLLAALAYVGSRIGEPYFRYYTFHDAVNQEARFATLRTDELIRQNICANADSLALPESAYRVQITRTPRIIRIHTAYDDHWSIWTYVRPVHFNVDIERPL